jgi:Cu/Ag efflux pump CusA
VARYGMSAGEVTKLLEAAFNGEVVAEVIDEAKIYDVFFQFDQNSRANIVKMQKTVLKLMPNGQKVTLEMVADVYETEGPNEINRENGQRRIVISANVSGRDLGGVVKEIQKKINENLDLPKGYYIAYGGQFESQQAATKRIILFSIISLFGIALVLLSHFKSRTIMIQIMATIPLAFIGGVFFLFLTERTITVASLVGFITLCGVASRNGIMMISHYLHLMKFEGEAFTKEMIIRGSQERLIPVLMTASVAALALLPLIFSKGQAGSEILYPVAVVIVGGLISSTFLDIIITPTLFYRYGKKSAEVYLKKQDDQKLN